METNTNRNTNTNNNNNNNKIKNTNHSENVKVKISENYILNGLCDYNFNYNKNSKEYKLGENIIIDEKSRELNIIGKITPKELSILFKLNILNILNIITIKQEEQEKTKTNQRK